MAQLATLEKEHGHDTIARLRRSIQARVIIERLTAHIKGELDMLPTQIQACALLLQRCLPSLTSVQVDVKEDDRPAVVRAPPPVIDATSWQVLVDQQTAHRNGNGAGNGQPAD